MVSCSLDETAKHKNASTERWERKAALRYLSLCCTLRCWSARGKQSTTLKDLKREVQALVTGSRHQLGVCCSGCCSRRYFMYNMASEVVVLCSISFVSFPLVSLMSPVLPHVCPPGAHVSLCGELDSVHQAAGLELAGCVHQLDSSWQKKFFVSSQIQGLLLSGRLPLHLHVAFLSSLHKLVTSSISPVLLLTVILHLFSPRFF